MKFKLLIIVFFLAAFRTVSGTENDSLKFLFIGNSITYFNNMPFMFREIANQKGEKVSVTMYAPGGTGFVNHYSDPNIFNLLRSNTWDVVVLQPGSGESAGASYPVDTTIKRGRKILDSLYHYSPCALVYLYQIPYGVPDASSYSTYFSVQTIIRDSVGKMADSLHLQVIPAGECFRAYYTVKPNLFLHNSFNDIHPNINGSFLVAATMYAGIFQKETVPSAYNGGIDPDSANIFFRIADSIVLNNLSDWRINTYNLHVDFTYQPNGESISFLNTSVNYSSLSWDFGDGQTASIPQVSHTYQQDGYYPVILTATATNGCQDSVTKVIQISATSEQDNENRNFLIFPNPANDFFYISPADQNLNAHYNLELFDLAGNRIIQKNSICGNYKMICNHLLSGEYLIRLEFENRQTCSRKVQIKH